MEIKLSHALKLFVWILALSIFGAGVVPAQEDSPLGPEDPAELGAFIDGLMTGHLEAYHSAGATVSVVKDGELLFSRGYGFADLGARKPVEAERTLFRVGSVSKLFIWTSVMQLVEQGKLDLNVDINKYLKGFQIPESFGKPITMTHLMTHTPGFEDVVVGLFGRDSKSLRPIGELLAEQIPARVRAPGAQSSYSNHGSAMAMYIVECITGVPWEEYIQENILTPLNMTRTTFTQPVPQRMAGDMSRGYAYIEDSLQEKDFEFVPLAPVGALSSTASDMANFMIAHLQLGRFGETRILKEDTARQMQSELFRHASGLNPMEHGFIDASMNGERIFGHGGDTFWFHTMLILLPEHNLGLFVSHNTDTGGEAAGMLAEQFIDRYFPAPESPEPAAPADFSSRAARFAGSYRSNRYSHTTIGKLVALEALEVTDAGDGALLLDSARMVEVSPLTFHIEDEKRMVVFREEEGEITSLFFSDLPIIAFNKLSTIERPASQIAVFAFAMLFFLTSFLCWPLAAIIRRRYKVSIPAEARMPAGSRLVAWGASTSFLVFLGLLGSLLSNPEVIVFGPTQDVYRTLSIPLVGAALACLALLYTLIIWRNRRGRLFTRIYYTLLTIAFAVFLGQLYYWNLLGFRF